MAFEGVSASGGEGMFPQHPRSGPWETLEGAALAPHIQQPLHSTAQGDSRHQAPTGMTHWDSKVIVSTGLTRGGGTMAK
ncbi:hypothetical protein SEA_OLICIOUS_5 [Streptomyces phage Olicious]|uniref:Uncharacterized protein n=4 Tax=Immanueltrevirus immanuel3 TaxID=2846399 RepID=A0A2H5BM01_9CAUD|nr:hypothetical protein SEA_HAUGEANATOR_5 [Streptomyces phage HaugeAnator]AUG87396.1 hypothetical protein SEA_PERCASTROPHE_5 [Streptomyces phage Percastrophe]AUG87588.1 hypothetical protein SEA_ZOOBEAR_5 [Streptomyces phage ZooBear]AZF95815.1 hypothetical protein SEA_OLICIOUS_5 [Streptomyces phage Olicious]UJQ86863.1 hypothetical protein SEA_TREAT_5 [Streptomyces phage Treat]UVK59101.1 hypothetical protein SEA_JPANDJE_6 [Streptomyces phage JPandJE]